MKKRCEICLRGEGLFERRGYSVAQSEGFLYCVHKKAFTKPNLVCRRWQKRPSASVDGGTRQGFEEAQRNVKALLKLLCGKDKPSF